MFSLRSMPPAAEEPPAGKPETLGSFLREARIAQGLELATIAEETRISLKNLLAIEEDNRAALPADVFSRGFVKIYAVYLKLDPHEAISRYERQWKPLPPFTIGPATRVKSASALNWSGLIIIVVLLALVIWGRLFNPGPDDGSGPQRYAAGRFTAMTEAGPGANGALDPCAGATGEGLTSHRP